MQPIKKKPIVKQLLSKKKGCRKLRVLLVLKSLGSLNEVVLWLKFLPWSVTWAFPFCSPIISWACGAQPNPSSSKRCGQQSARCDHQLITHYPSNQAQSLHRCEASLVLNTLTGRSATDERQKDRRKTATNWLCQRASVDSMRISLFWREVSLREPHQINL